jgi:adenylate cyclase
LQSHAGDGVMCLFPTDSQAVRAARQLQEGIARFNAEQNRLPMPFRLRCGVSVGDVPIEEGQPLGHMQSPVIDRAAILQKRAEPGDILISGDIAAAALMELDGAAPLLQPGSAETVFSWRAGRRTASSL